MYDVHLTYDNEKYLQIKTNDYIGNDQKRFQLEGTAVVSHTIERGQESVKIDDAEALRKGKVNDNVLIALVKQLLAYRGAGSLSLDVMRIAFGQII